MKTNRKLLTLILVLAMIFSFVPTALAAIPAGKEIIILHTNDIHNRVDDNLGYAGVKALKDELEAEGKNVILLEAGDVLHGMPIANLTDGLTIVEIMNAVGYTAMAPGNHDFNFGTARLIELAKEADFDILSANLTAADGKNVFAASKIYELDGVKVGIVGLSTPETKTKSAPKNTEGYSFNDDKLAELAQAEINTLKTGGADCIVILGHLGIDSESAPWRSTDVIAKISGADIFIDGHSHSKLEEGQLIKDKDGKDVLLAQTGEYINAIGKITVNSDGAKAELVTEVEKDEDITTLINAKKDEIEPLLNKVLAKTDVLLNGERAPGNRTEETNLGDLAADALKYVSGADIALTNGGGIRVSIQIGDITYGMLNAVFPFGNIVTVIELTGADILASLVHGNAAAPEASGGFPQVAGLSYEVHSYQADNRIQNVKINGEELDPAKKYTMATNDFTAAGGDGYEMFTGAPVIGYYGAMDEALVTYIVDELDGVVPEEYSGPQGRITVLKNETPFTDVKYGVWYYDAVRFMYDNGITEGTTPTTFDGQTQLTRAMFVTFLGRTYELSGDTISDQESYFTDVREGQYYSDYANWAGNYGIDSGIDTTEFRPTDNITREEIAMMCYGLAEALDLDMDYEVSDTEFADADDVSEDALTAVEWAIANEIITGTDRNGTLYIAPGNNATRFEASTMIYRLVARVLDAEPVTA